MKTASHTNVQKNMVSISLSNSSEHFSLKENKKNKQVLVARISKINIFADNEIFIFIYSKGD